MLASGPAWLLHLSASLPRDSKLVQVRNEPQMFSISHTEVWSKGGSPEACTIEIRRLSLRGGNADGLDALSVPVTTGMLSAVLWHVSTQVAIITTSLQMKGPSPFEHRAK